MRRKTFIGKAFFFSYLLNSNGNNTVKLYCYFDSAFFTAIIQEKGNKNIRSIPSYHKVSGKTLD